MYQNIYLFTFYNPLLISGIFLLQMNNDEHAQPNVLKYSVRDSYITTATTTTSITTTTSPTTLKA